LASRLAAQIENDIVKAGWPVGELFGSEIDLMERYGVSRSILREAIRLLEHHLVAEMRRGRSGGLYVTQPDPVVIADAVALFLRYRNVSARDLFEVRRSLEVTAVRLAAEGADAAQAQHLLELAEVDTGSTDAELAERSDAFHYALGEMTGNPAIHLFVQVAILLTATVLDHPSGEHVATGVSRAHRAIAKAVEKGDGALAQRRMLTHYEAMTEVGFPE
jgi:DNA-binding FadR family transcriptional regulator